ncbi:hypothetical protein LEMA_P045870.1 [Plenodomus lingam JN3]|uniref:C2 domain-containing protein n=1 Tax=Leptosphaeria maculans (strain JN3 / isolate v23.1.3 / race Av1-4-5-6-7-8) TaxID=985895 RepID=E5R4B3_LEPMJ|nr:hypothetical protein LEMA_P045870.1 [Plenodomus lingam JN3]CBX91881.1 hypothetical protein LEMA_P045870.1 [Plenodomus lingam JN3]
MDSTSAMSSVRLSPPSPPPTICWALYTVCCSLLPLHRIVCPSVRRLHKSRSITGFPDPFAVATINGEQTRTTNVIKKTLNPYWNESFDMYVMSPHASFHPFPAQRPHPSTALIHTTGESMRRAFWQSRSSTRRSSRRRTRASWASSMSALVP